MQGQVSSINVFHWLLSQIMLFLRRQNVTIDASAWSNAVGRLEHSSPSSSDCTNAIASLLHATVHRFLVMLGEPALLCSIVIYQCQLISCLHSFYKLLNWVASCRDSWHRNISIGGNEAHKQSGLRWWLLGQRLCCLLICLPNVMIMHIAQMCVSQTSSRVIILVGALNEHSTRFRHYGAIVPEVGSTLIQMMLTIKACCANQAHC